VLGFVLKVHKYTGATLRISTTEVQNNNNNNIKVTIASYFTISKKNKMALSSSILGCLKSGGGIDVKKACRYFQELDVASDEQPRMARSKSSSLLEIMSSPSFTLDPHWFINQMDAMENDLQDWLTSFLIDDNPQPRVKHPHGERTMLLELTQADGTWRQALPSDTHWYFMYVRHPMIQCSKFHRLFRRQFRLPYDQYLAFLADT